MQPLFLQGCATAPDDSAALARAVYDYLDEIPGPVYYFPGRTDLDGDKVAEGIVRLAGPAACRTGGCPTLVYRSSGGAYELVAEIGPARPPVRVSRSSTNGWRDLAGADQARSHQPLTIPVRINRTVR